MNRFLNRSVMACALAVTAFGASYANAEPWVSVKTLVIPRPQPGKADYATTTETFLDKGSIESAGPYKKAAFKQSAKDNTGYEMQFGKEQLNWYYYDCKAGQVAWSSSGLPDPAKFKPYAQYQADRPNLPHGDANVVSLVCGSR